MTRVAVAIAGASLLFACIAAYFTILVSHELEQTKQELRQQGKDFREVQAATSKALLTLEETIRQERMSRSPTSSAQRSLLAIAPQTSQNAENAVQLEENTPAASRANEAFYERFHNLRGKAKVAALRDIANLAKRGDKRAAGVILGALEDEDELIRARAAQALGSIGDPQFLSQLEAASRDSSSSVREEAASALRNMPADEAGPILTGLLADKSSEVVEESLGSLAALRYKEAYSKISELARGDDFSIAAPAGAALRRLGDDESADEVLARVAGGLQSKDSLDRRRAVRNILKIGGAAAIPYLKKALEDESPPVREKAKDALAELQSGQDGS